MCQAPLTAPLKVAGMQALPRTITLRRQGPCVHTDLSCASTSNAVMSTPRGTLPLLRQADSCGSMKHVSAAMFRRLYQRNCLSRRGSASCSSSDWFASGLWQLYLI